MNQLSDLEKTANFERMLTELLKDKHYEFRRAFIFPFTNWRDRTAAGLSTKVQFGHANVTPYLPAVPLVSHCTLPEFFFL